MVKTFATSEADGLEEGDAGAGAQVEEVVLGALQNRLTLVPVVVHVEPLAPEHQQHDVQEAAHLCRSSGGESVMPD